MGNILVDVFPTAIEIDGKEYEINTHFQTCLRIILAFEDPELAVVEKQLVLLENLYNEEPDNLEQALVQGIKFLNGGDEMDEDEDAGPRIYSFEKDAKLILGAFQQTHQIDLNKSDLHWWKFIALFMDLGHNTAFASVVNLRSRIKTGKATREERILAEELHDLINLPALDQKTLEEMELRKVFYDALEGGK